MTTLDPHTAPGLPIGPSLAELSARVRHLWTREPYARGREREELITSLSEIDIAVDRLSIRARCDLVKAEDTTDITRWAHRLADLEWRWRANRDRATAG